LCPFAATGLVLLVTEATIIDDLQNNLPGFLRNIQEPKAGIVKMRVGIPLAPNTVSIKFQNRARITVFWQINA
jgi:hypothetical protein